MLQTNYGGVPVQMTVFNPMIAESISGSIAGSSTAAGFDRNQAPCPMTAQLLVLFEQITGWKAEFEESNSSIQHRKLSSSKAEPARGTFSIVDMSENWPPQKPTCHRGKCDQFIAILDYLVDELQSAQSEMNRTQSALVALDATAEIEDDVLVDSFIPKFGLLSDSVIEISDSDQADAIPDFEVFQPDSGSFAAPVCPPFEGWSFGGSTGIAGSYYLDWLVDGEERISICAGEINTETGLDRETVIQVDPLTNEYRVVPNERVRENDNVPEAFHLWDSNLLSLTPVNPSASWQVLKSHQAIVATTGALSGEAEWSHWAVEAFGDQAEECKSSSAQASTGSSASVQSLSTKAISASQLAELLIQGVGPCDPLLVLKRD